MLPIAWGQIEGRGCWGPIPLGGRNTEHETICRYIYIYVAGTFWYNATVLLSDSHLFPYLSPCLFPTCLLISLSPLRFFSLGAFGQRNLLVSRSSLLSPLLSVLRSGGFRDRTQVPSVFVLVSLLHSHMWLFSLGASGAQYAPCPLSVSVLVPLVLSNSCPYFSLSLLLFFSLGAYLHDSLRFLTCPPLSSLVPSNVYP